MLLETTRWLFVIVGWVGVIALTASVVLLFVTVGQGFWQGIRLAKEPGRDRIQFHFVMKRMHLLMWVFYTSFACILIAKALQYFIRDSLE